MFLQPNCVYIIKSDEGKYLVVCLDKITTEPFYAMRTEREDEPLEYYQLNHMPISMNFIYYPAKHGYKVITKVFTNYQKAIEYISNLGIMNETNPT